MGREYFDLNNRGIIKLAKSLKRRLGGNKEVVLVCIGSMRLLGDSVAPRIGSRLHELGINCVIYGNQEKPVHAMNLEKAIETINKKHKDALVVAIDASIGKETKKILVHDGQIKPGAALNKELPPIGDVSIKCVVSKDINDFWEVDHYTVQSFVTHVSKGIMLATK